MQAKQKEIEIFFNSIITEISEEDYTSISKEVMAVKDKKKNNVAQQKINLHIEKIPNVKLQEFLQSKPHEDIAKLSKLLQKAASQRNNSNTNKQTDTLSVESNTNINSEKIIKDKNQHVFIEQFTDKTDTKVCLYGIAVNNKTKAIHVVYCNEDTNNDSHIRILNFSVVDYILKDINNETTLTFNILNTPLYKYLYNTDIITWNSETLIKQGFNMKLLIGDIVSHFKSEMFAQYTTQVHDVLPYDDECKTITKKLKELLSSWMNTHNNTNNYI